MRRLAILSILLIPGGLYAQVEVRDTLRESIITAVRRSTLMTGELRTDMEGMKAAASPLGEGDPIRWIQYLPGVTAGADAITFGPGFVRPPSYAAVTSGAISSPLTAFLSTGIRMCWASPRSYLLRR